MIYNITESYSMLDNPISEVLYNIRETINEFEYDIELYNNGYLMEADNNNGEKKSILKRFIDFCKSIIDYIKSVPGKIRKMISKHKGSSEEKKKLKSAEQEAEKLKQEKIDTIEKEVEYINKLKEDDDKYIEEVIKRFNRVKQITNDFDKGIIDTGIVSKDIYDNSSVYTIIDKNNPDYGYKFVRDKKGWDTLGSFSNNRYNKQCSTNNSDFDVVYGTKDTEHPIYTKAGDGYFTQTVYNNGGSMVYRNNNGDESWYDKYEKKMKSKFPGYEAEYEI